MDITNPSTSAASRTDDPPAKDKDSEEDVRQLDPFIDFTCGNCGLAEKCLYGELKAFDGFYPSPVFFMRDPFAPPQRLKTRRPLLADYLVIGCSCSMCNQPVCISKSCSIFFGAHFCATCIVRERRRFPAEVLEILSKAQEVPKKEAEITPAVTIAKTTKHK